MLDFKELRDKSVKDLQDLLAERRQALRQFRFEARERQIKNVRARRGVRKEVARLLTALRTKLKVS